MPQLEKSPHSNKNPAQQKINKIFLKIRERRDLNRDIKEKAMERQPQAKELQAIPESGRARKDPPQSLPREHTSISDF